MQSLTGPRNRSVRFCIIDNDEWHCVPAYPGPDRGAMAAFRPARKLYAGFGFKYCSPFGDYLEDPNSVFTTRSLTEEN